MCMYVSRRRAVFRAGYLVPSWSLTDIYIDSKRSTAAAVMSVVGMMVNAQTGRFRERQIMLEHVSNNG